MKLARPSMLVAILVAILLAFLAGSAAKFSSPRAHAAARPPEAPNFVLVVHGGAGSYNRMPADALEARRATMGRAMEAGYKILSVGGASLDAVEATLRVLEDSGQFDAGRGAYYTREGVPELDAAIMDGRTLGAGAVASVQHIANPISLARMVMEKTPHVLLVGRGAEDFARSQGVSLVSPYYFFNDDLWKLYENMRSEDQKKKSADLFRSAIYGTVGAVALDQAGNLAAGTTTGGTAYKMPGRVGDSPIIGAGTYANNESCAVSGTGVGEFYMRDTVAADICARVRYLRVPLEQAADDVVMKELVAQKGEGGVIALDRQGHVATPFNTDGMMHGVIRADGKPTIQVRHE
jgi:L-asparaginase / beta-aspartyl-peptidase